MPVKSNDLYLSEDALLAFDNDFRDWEKYSELITNWAASNSIESILDVGGGNGLLMDKLLELFPRANGCVLDCAESMLGKNVPHSRKTIKRGSATELDRLFPNQHFDLITINMLLHHLVADNEKATKSNVLSTLKAARNILSPDGIVVIYEQIYDGLIPFLEPGKIIYRLTSIRTSWIARALKGMGANTAGVGVRFRSRENWRNLFIEAGFSIVSESHVLLDKPSITRRLPLNIKQVGSYFLR